MVTISSEFENDKLEVSTHDEIVLYTSKNTVVKKIRTFGKWQISKEIAPDFAFNAKHRLSLEQEFEIGYQLDHPNIVRYIDKKVHDNGVPYLILEYIDGCTLREIIDDKKQLSKQDFDTIFSSLLSALVYIHNKQIYHLDIKPENIILTHKERSLKLLDFGFAITAANETTLGSSKKYVAPEFSIRTDDISGKTDMYAFAKTMQELSIAKSHSLSGAQKKIIQLSIEEDFSKRISAKQAWDILQKQTRAWWLLFVILFLTIVLGSIFLLSHKKDNHTFIPPQDSDTVIIEEPRVLDTTTATNQPTTTTYGQSSSPSKPQVQTAQTSEESRVEQTSDDPLFISQVMKKDASPKEYQPIYTMYANKSKVKYNAEDSLFITKEVEKHLQRVKKNDTILESNLQKYQQLLKEGSISIDTYMKDQDSIGKVCIKVATASAEQMQRAIQTYLHGRYNVDDIDTYNYYYNEFLTRLLQEATVSR